MHKETGMYCLVQVTNITTILFLLSDYGENYSFCIRESKKQERKRKSPFLIICVYFIQFDTKAGLSYNPLTLKTFCNVKKLHNVHFI